MTILIGSAGNDTLTGGDLADFLNGLSGPDKLTGGKENDVYYVDNTGDVVIELANQGNEDRVLASTSIAALANNVEDLQLLGGADLGGTGNSLENFIQGNLGKNALSGGSGDDTLNGQGGDDVLNGDAGDDVLDGSAGNDQVNGGDGNDFVIGGADDDTLSGGAGNDRLEGDAGTNTLAGGTGNDVYVVGPGIDTFTELTGQGTDTVESAATFTLVGVANIENLTLTNNNNVNGTGNDLDNVLTGNDGQNKLDGGKGNDTLFGHDGTDTLLGGEGNDTLDGGAAADAMAGGKGNDTYVVDDTNDAITENTGEGIDLVKASTDYDLSQNTGEEIENLTLTDTGNFAGTGNEFANIITGNAGNNTLLGGAGNDTLVGGDGNDTLDGQGDDDAMTGGAGNDEYHVDSVKDKVTEAANGGIDEVLSKISYTLGANVENLSFGIASVGNVDGLGNTLDNVMIGSNGDNKLDGGAGNDDLRGGIGNDTLIGGAGNDKLDGGTGVNDLRGGAGNDLYIVGLNDTVTELAGQGTDEVQSASNFDLSLNGLNVENLTLTGTAITGTGNALANIITGDGKNNVLLGGDGNDTLDGGTGKDAMNGGKGDDTYIVDDAGDGINDTDGGKDTVKSSVNFSLDVADGQVVGDVENLILTGKGDIDGTGNALANTITGNVGDNTLDGGAGSDTLAGGAGNDFYLVDSTTDKVTELANEGTDDTVLTTLATYVLGANLEGLGFDDTVVHGATGTGNGLDNQITGTDGKDKLDGGAGDDHLFGNDNDDILIGGTGNDILDGNLGNDAMTGGTGNDRYEVDSIGDTVTEAANGGIDQIRTSLGSFDLSLHGANVENLQFVGAGIGIGNDLDNVMGGSSFSDNLSGGKGQDTLVGSLGTDTLSGGEGNDVVEGGLGADTLAGGAGNDLFLYRLDNNADLAQLGGDTISDFEHGKDRIDLRDLFEDFNIQSHDPVADGFLKVEVSGLDTLVKFDSNGGGDSFVTLVTLQNTTTATVADVVF